MINCNYFTKEKQECADIALDARNKLIHILNRIGTIENVSIPIKRDLGDFVEYVEVNKIEDNKVYFVPNDFYPSGEEDLDELSFNELYDLIMGVHRFGN